MSEAPSLEPGTIIAGKYRIDGLLGKGGMGTVFCATNTAIGRRVAIKLLAAAVSDREDVKERFELEAQAAAVIGHPGIVDVLDMGETDEGDPFIVMEYLEGATLKGVFKRIGAFTPAQAAAVVCPVLDALAAAHSAGVIHRDVKPANVFVCTKPTRTIKLLDFGISRFGKSTGLTVTGTAVGTPKYMAPEQVLGEKDLGPEADLYSVGAVMYHLLTGRPPHDADSDMATLARILTDVHQPLRSVRPELPAALCTLVDTLLSKDRAVRQKDAAAVRRELLALVPRVDEDALYEAALKAVKVQAAGTPHPSSPSGKPKTKSGAPGARKNSAEHTVVAAPAKSPLIAVIVAVLALALVVIGGLTAVVLLRQPPPVVAVAPVPAAAPPAVSFTATLSAEPTEARFTVDGQAMDCNPCTLSRPTGSRIQVRVGAPSFSPSELELTFDRDRTQHVILSALPAAPQPTVDAGRPVANTKKKPGRNLNVDGRNLNVDERNPYQ